MNTGDLRTIFSEEVLAEIFPRQRTDDFFEAMFGDASEGAYDIRLRFSRYHENSSSLEFRLDLLERPGCCLVCNLTYGLPEVFARHPVINIKGLVSDIEQKLNGRATCQDWKFGTTVQQERNRHYIPLHITVEEA